MSLSSSGIRLHFLGGADSIGASATLVEIGEARLLVDCGIRLGASGGDALPDLDRVRQAGPCDAIVLTHAHLDHSGALPVIARNLPGVPIYCTPPTADLMRILLRNSAGLMRLREEGEGEIPLYRPEEIDAAFERIVPVHFGVPFAFPAGAPWSGRFFAAGHILGAAALSLESDAGRIFFTGDCALSEQRTVAGMSIPPIRANLAVIESTYGNRLHSDRAGQERALVRQIREVYERGGKVLIPAFAIGRAQEVLLILRSAIARGELPDHPVLVDGMVTPVCGVYGDHPHYLSGRLYRRTVRERSLFFSEHVRAIATPRERDAVLAGGACTIVASSGMLSGGPSAWYAERLALQPENLIAITGYQDEESPGRRLLDLAAGRTAEVLLPGGAVPVRCQVATYALSAHADSDELTALAGRVRPDEVVLVHGDEGARAELSRKIHAQLRREVLLPSNGELVFARGGRPSPRSGSRSTGRTGIGEGRPVDADAVVSLYTRLVNETGAGPGRTLYSLADLAERWSGRVASNEEIDAWAALLKEETCFAADPRRPYLFRPLPIEEAHRTFLEKRRDEDRSPWTAVFERIREALGPDAGIAKESYQADRKRIILHFRFPAIAERRHSRALRGIEQETGWEIQIHPNQNKTFLLEAIQDRVGAAVRLAGSVAYRDDERRARVRIERPDETARAAMRAAADSFRSETGWSLEWEEVAAPADPVAAGDLPGRGDPPPPPSGGPIEINAAYGLIDAAFAGEEHRPYRRGLKSGADGEYIEVSFVTPEVGNRQRERLEELSARIGRPLRINPYPNQVAIAGRARELLRPHGGVQREPKLHVADRTVVVRPAAPLEPSVEEEIRAAYAAFCGYEMRFE